jgi:hypothetical protein
MPTELSMADDLDALDALLEEPLKKVIQTGLLATTDQVLSSSADRSSEDILKHLQKSL